MERLLLLGAKVRKRADRPEPRSWQAQQRSESARKAGSARWPKVKGLNGEIVGSSKKIATWNIANREEPAQTTDTSDEALAVLLNRLKANLRMPKIRRPRPQGSWINC